MFNVHQHRFRHSLDEEAKGSTSDKSKFYSPWYHSSFGTAERFASPVGLYCLHTPNLTHVKKYSNGPAQYQPKKLKAGGYAAYGSRPRFDSSAKQTPAPGEHEKFHDAIASRGLERMVSVPKTHPRFPDSRTLTPGPGKYRAKNLKDNPKWSTPVEQRFRVKTDGLRPAPWDYLRKSEFDPHKANLDLPHRAATAPHQVQREHVLHGMTYLSRDFGPHCSAHIRPFTQQHAKSYKSRYGDTWKTFKTIPDPPSKWAEADFDFDE